MTTQPLPDHPDLDQLRRQAKELRNAAWRDLPDAVARLGRYFDPDSPVTLARAQLVIARESGFVSWPQLKSEVERRTLDLTERVRDFLRASVTGHLSADAAARGGRAAQLLDDDPRIATYDLRTAAVLGDVEQVRTRVARDPSLAARADPEAGWPPLLFVCNSRWHRLDPPRLDGLLRTAQLLLDAGASPNAAVGDEAPAGRCAPLYAAAGLANNPELARLLLDRGADPDTPSALYHTAFHADHAGLQLLLDRGAIAEAHDTLAAAISVRDLEAVRLLLDAGVDPRRALPPEALGESYGREPPVGPVYAAIEFDCPGELIELLLARGADPDAPGQSGWSPRRLVARRGRAEIVELLDRYGARDDTTDVDRFLDACTRSDRAAARRLLDRDPGLLGRLTDEEHGVLVDAAERGRTEAVVLLLDLGFPVDVHAGVDGPTPLHAAAGSGCVDLVRLLIDRGADIDSRDTTWGATPLCWATVGSGLGLHQGLDPDWAAVVEALLAAGSSTDGVWVEAKPPSYEVAAVLRSHGIGPPES